MIGIASAPRISAVLARVRCRWLAGASRTALWHLPRRCGAPAAECPMLTKAAAPGLIAVKVPSSPGARPVPVVAGGPAIGWDTGPESGEEARVPYGDIGEA